MSIKSLPNIIFFEQQRIYKRKFSNEVPIKIGYRPKLTRLKLKEFIMRWTITEVCCGKTGSVPKFFISAA